MMLFSNIKKSGYSFFDKSLHFRIDFADKRTFEIIYRFESFFGLSVYIPIDSMGWKYYDSFIIPYLIYGLYKKYSLFFKIFGDLGIVHERMDTKNLLSRMAQNYFIELVYRSFNAETETWRSQIINDFHD